MDTCQVKATVFDSIFDLFKELIKKNSKEEFIDFCQGLPDDWEKYKIPIANLAYERLNVDNWRNSDIGKGKIIDGVISAIEIKSEDTGLENNLVHWIPKQGRPKEHLRLLQVRDTADNLEEYERSFYNFYKNKISPEETMVQFIKLLGQKYPLISYFFFIKNPHQYLPIAPKYFDSVFNYLDLDFRTFKQCSWGNYKNYIDIIVQIQNYLILKEIKNVRLIDAHSFCWIIASLTKEDSIMQNKFQAAKKTLHKPIFQLITDINPGKGLTWERDNKSYRKRDVDHYKNKHERDTFIGKKAEDLVFTHEIDKLKDLGLFDKANQVKKVSDIPDFGYDIESFNENGDSICIEVKAVKIKGEELSFFLTNHEYEISNSIENYFYYLVSFRNPNKPVILGFHSSLLTKDYLKPEIYQVFLQKN